MAVLLWIFWQAVAANARADHQLEFVLADRLLFSSFDEKKFEDKLRAPAQKSDDRVGGFGENFDDGRDLFSHISPEEIRACTTCNACVEACPILINPLDIILQLRRYEILTLSQGPTDWVPMFTSLENGGSPWQMSDERAKWTTQM